MAQRAFFLNTLHEGVKPEDYEQWLRDVDYPFARALPTIIRYDVSRIEGNLFGSEGEAPCQYLEVIDITGANEIVMATDGYIEPRSTLAESEMLLAERIARDPLMIDGTPQTKGVQPGANSFDDRLYLRVALVPAGD